MSLNQPLNFDYLDTVFGDNPEEYARFLEKTALDFEIRKTNAQNALAGRDEQAVSDLRHQCRAMLVPLKAEEFIQIFSEQRQIADFDKEKLRGNGQKLAAAFDAFIAAVRAKKELL